MTYHPKDGVLAPFTSTEIFVVTRARLIETRNVIGLSLFATKTIRWDVGYMLRPRQTNEGWDLSHVGMVTFTFAPELAPIVESGGG